MSILYIFCDHSGDIRFIPQSSKYFTLACLSTWNPTEFAAAYHQLKHDLVLNDGKGSWDYHRFHASEDPLWVRSAYLKLIGERTDIRGDTITVRKNRIFKEYQPIHVFYPHMMNLLLKHVLPIVTSDKSPERIEFIIDQFPIKQQPLQETFKKKMSVQFNRICSDTPYRVSYHYSHAHPHLQVADYCAWAVFRLYESGRDDTRNYLRGNLIRSEWEYATRTTHQSY